MSEQRLVTAVHAIMRQAGLAGKGGCHLFRHAFATHLLHAGCDLRHIQMILVHASLESTQIYTHVNITQLVEVHRRYHPAQMRGVALSGNEG